MESILIEVLRFNGGCRDVRASYADKSSCCEELLQAVGISSDPGRPDESRWSPNLAATSCGAICKRGLLLEAWRMAAEDSDGNTEADMCKC